MFEIGNLIRAAAAEVSAVKKMKKSAFKKKPKPGKKTITKVGKPVKMGKRWMATVSFTKKGEKLSQQAFFAGKKPPKLRVKGGKLEVTTKAEDGTVTKYIWGQKEASEKAAREEKKEAAEKEGGMDEAETSDGPDPSVDPSARRWRRHRRLGIGGPSPADWDEEDKAIEEEQKLKPSGLPPGFKKKKKRIGIGGPSPADWDEEDKAIEEEQ
jgi:hypothetical protein